MDKMITRHQVFEVTIEVESGEFTWNRFIMGPLLIEKVLHLLDEEIEESRQLQLNEMGSPTLVELHTMYRNLVSDFGLPKGTQKECIAYGMKVGTIYVVRSPEVIQIEGF